MDIGFYQQLINEVPAGYAYHKIICDSKGVPCDYEFIEANIAFEQITGLQIGKIIGKKVTEVLGNREDTAEWIRIYGEIALDGGSKEFERFSEELHHWYKVKVYSPEKYYFITYFNDISKEMERLVNMQRLSTMSDQFLQLIENEIDYQKITDDLLKLSGAKYAAFNLYAEDGKSFSTMATAGNIGLIKKAAGIIGFKFENKKWEHDPVRAEQIKDSIVTRYSSLSEIAGHVLPKTIIYTLEKVFHIGQFVLVKIVKQDTMLGDFTLIMQKGHEFDKDEIAEIYTRQLGLVIARKRTEKTLKESEVKYRSLFESARDAILVADIEKGQIIDANKTACQLTGYTYEEFLGKSVYDLQPPELEVDTFNQFIRKTRAEQNLFETLLLTRSGKRIPIEISTGQIYRVGNQHVMTGFFRDITERKAAEAALRTSEEKYRLLTEFASDVIWVYNFTRNTFTYISPSVFSLRGITVAEAMEEGLEDALIPESFEIARNKMQQIANDFLKNPNESLNYIDEVQQPCKNGKIIWVELSAKYRYNLNGEIEIVGASRNIEERKKAASEVLYLSNHDQLTGLYNRRYYENEIQKINKEACFPLTLAMLDVNGLKLTNDAFGHKAGDLVLQKVASVLKRECREQDVVARIGGDEFVLLLPQTDTNDANQFIERIITAIANEQIEHGILSISIGYAVKSDHSVDMNEIFMQAEDDMYRHKLSESSSMRSKTINLIMNSLYEKNHREMLHSKRVSGLCEEIAKKMDFEKNGVNQIRIAGLMHDIGKIGIDEKILNKEAGLNGDEMKEIHRHSEIGYRILSSVNEFSEIADYILEHHERWNGKGYPKGLKEKEISVQARIIAVADTYDAMTSDRPYRKAVSEEQAVFELEKYSRILYDPDIVDVFIHKVLGEERNKNQKSPLVSDRQ